jgi:hypothetical protein
LEKGVQSALFFGIIGTVIGGLILSFIYFVLHDYAYKLPEINGAWTFTTSVTDTSYNLYNGLQVTYLVLIWTEGNRIVGTAEKVSEVTADGRLHEYIGDKRVNAKVSGYISKNYLKNDKITIHLEESGRQRLSSSIHELTVVSTNKLNGVFLSTAANTKGSVVCTKRRACNI